MVQKKRNRLTFCSKKEKNYFLFQKEKKQTYFLFQKEKKTDSSLRSKSKKKTFLWSKIRKKQTFLWSKIRKKQTFLWCLKKKKESPFVPKQTKNCEHNQFHESFAQKPKSNPLTENIWGKNSELLQMVGLKLSSSVIRGAKSLSA